MNLSELSARRLADLRPLLGSTKLLIVSKNRSLEEIRAYYDLGQRDFGENKVQELSDKASSLLSSCPEIRWHMIGHLQSNKINQLFRVPNLVSIHSVHDRQLVDKLIQAEAKLNSPVGVFLQFNTSRELEKAGFETYTDLRMAAERLSSKGPLKLQGLMTMGTLRTENFEAEARRCFEELRVLKEKLEAELSHPLELSMGMSQDYRFALQEKSDWIRLGTMMFERP